MKEYIFNNSILIKPEDLNPAGKLFGGRVLQHIDEKAALFAYCQLNKKQEDLIVTKLISEIDFVSSATNGDIVEFGFKVINVGRSSLSLECLVRNKTTEETIIHIDKIIFVNVDKDLKPKPHGYTMETIRGYN